MTITLGGITLSDHLILTGDITAQRVVANKRRTIGGEAHITTATVSSGDDLILSGENHFTRAQIVSIKELEAARTAVSLVHHTGTYIVLVTGTNVEQTFNYADPVSTDWYSGDITMIRVD